jgi:adenylate cyclase
MTAVGDGRLEPLEKERFSTITEVKEAANSFNQMVIGLRQKKVLEHFVPEGTRKEIEALQGRTTGLGGQRWERTIMFSDLRGFTSMSEKLAPDEVMAVLNKYLHVMSRAIRLNGGDINEYIGDAILAVFESPDAAVKGAIAMNEELIKLREDTSIAALSGLAQGIGLHTGPLVEGNIGEENRRLKRAVVGDTVNLAARIQDRSRDGSHSCIFLSQDTKDRLTESVDLVYFGEEEFKGKAVPVPVWEVKLDS